MTAEQFVVNKLQKGNGGGGNEMDGKEQEKNIIAFQICWDYKLLFIDKSKSKTQI